MTKIYALYDTLNQSDQAVKAVAAADLDGLDIRVIEEIPGRLADPGVPTGVVPVPSNLSSSGVAAALSSSDPATDIFAGADLEEAQKAFLTRGVKQGGTLVVVDTPNSSLNEVTRILEDKGGRVLPD